MKGHLTQIIGDYKILSTMNKNYYAIIMAGGVGSRFWPVSRNGMPKQFLDILGVGKSFLQMTVSRFEKIVPIENILIVDRKSVV